MKFFFPIHLDGGNRGCEAIAKGTATIINEPKENLYGLCRNIKLDTRLGVDKYLTLIRPVFLSFLSRVKNKIIRTLNLPIKQDADNAYLVFLERMTKEDVMIATGGDMMCYTNNMVITTNNQAHNIGCKTILWGSSMGPENLTPEKEDTLRKFSLVYARESLSYDFFKNLGLINVCLYPDPAFILEPEKCHLPNCFSKGDVIGINLSNFVLGGFSLDTPFGKEVIMMIDYIIEETNLQILLIPHVTWNGQDDRIIAQVVMQKYQSTERISVLDVNFFNYCQIRYIISKCKMFIGGRTHGVISAYSTCVPAIAIGYSIKSRGIAKDLALSEKLVVDSKIIRKVGYLLDSLKYMIENENNIREHLKEIIPEYRKSTYGVRENLRSLFNS